MTTKTKIIVASVSLLTAFALGRYTVPTKTKIEVRTVTVEKTIDKTQTQTDQDKHKETTVTETIKPDGTKQTVTQTVEDTQTQKDQKTVDTSQTQTTQDKTKEITRQGSPVTILALAGVSYHNLSTPVYGASVSRNLLGPISMGVWGLSSGTFGVGVGLSF